MKSFSKLILLLGVLSNSFAQVIPKISLGVDQAENPGDVSVTLQIVALMTILSLVPSIVVMLTSFTRISVVLNFLKQALGTQNAPPNQVVMGLSMFLTFFVMAPTFSKVNDEALQPYLAEEISYKTAMENAWTPMRDFMLRQTGEKELALMVRMSRSENPKTIEDLSFSQIVPAFILSELKTAFIIGFLIYIPFLIIDMTVASVLMAMGMMMLPPPMISLPMKLILFVLVDGWTLIVQQLLLSFR